MTQHQLLSMLGIPHEFNSMTSTRDFLSVGHLPLRLKLFLGFFSFLFKSAFILLTELHVFSYRVSTVGSMALEFMSRKNLSYFFNCPSVSILLLSPSYCCVASSVSLVWFTYVVDQILQQIIFKKTWICSLHPCLVFILSPCSLMCNTHHTPVYQHTSIPP